MNVNFANNFAIQLEKQNEHIVSIPVGWNEGPKYLKDITYAVICFKPRVSLPAYTALKKNNSVSKYL